LVAVALVPVLAAGPASAGADAAPGTATRPVLSSAEAARFTPSAYLEHSGPYAAPVVDPWRPGPVRTIGVRPDVVVRPGDSVQQAVNMAFRLGGERRRYVLLLPGVYPGTVFIPAGGPPLTLYGFGDVRIEFSLDAGITPAAWAAAVNPSGQYVEGDPAWAMYQSCATRTQVTIGLCASVVWSESPGLEVAGLTIVNTLPDVAGTHQALALRTDADRTLVERVRLISRQDTFHTNAADAARIARVVVRDSYIEGDTDFVFGRATAVFERVHFHVVSTRKPTNGVVFAPSTNPLYPFGFLVRHSLITTDAGYDGAPTAHLGRAWDQSAGSTGYLPDISPNGQLVICESVIDAGYDAVAPWAAAATTARPFVGNVDPNRNLDDPLFNRLWEYHNKTLR
jgi:pectinesterase